MSAGIGVGGLGVVLSTSPPAQQGYEPLEKLPQFVINETLYDRNWRQMAFVFTATDAFSFFTFGLFDRDEIRLSREEGGERTMAYYFLDDFQIEEVESALMSEERPDRGTPGVALPDGVYIPNAFTPDGNHINDVWSLALPQGMKVKWSCLIDGVSKSFPNGCLRTKSEHGTGTILLENHALQVYMDGG